MTIILSPSGTQVRTALDIIRGALELTNAVGSDQTLSSGEIDDSLSEFNDLLEYFSTRNLAVYGQADQTFNTVVGQSVYTIGPNGDWNTLRPERINNPAYSVINGVTFMCNEMTQAEYNSIAVKGQQQAFPMKYLYVNDYPLGIITLWPMPNAVTPVTFSIDRQLTAITNASDPVYFPLGYARAFKYMLAIALASFFGIKIQDYPEVIAEAKSSFAAICRANKKKRTMTYDAAILQQGVTRASFYRGW